MARCLLWSFRVKPDVAALQERRLPIRCASTQRRILRVKDEWPVERQPATTTEGHLMTRLNIDDCDTLRQQRVVLLATDHQHSVVAELVAVQAHPIAYSAYGCQSSQQEIATHLGFNGELRETPVGWYLLGNGYRAYNPMLMRFHSPDSSSPFGGGGLNAYAYCEGEPINHSDPTGHVRLPKFLTGLSGRSITGAPSTSDLRPLIPSTASVPGSKPISARAIETHKSGTPKTFIKTTRDFIDYGPHRDTPPPIPSKKPIPPRFNDTGGQVGILSPKQTLGQKARYREVWTSEPFQFPLDPAPVPPTRTLPGGATRHYFVRYDAQGNPSQSSVEKITVSARREAIRNAEP